MANKHMKIKFSYSLVIRKMQMKSVRYYFIPIRLVKIKVTSNVDENKVKGTLKALLVGV